MKAIISDEKLVRVLESDSDGAYWERQTHGTVRYTCCGFVKNCKTFMADGDGDQCPNCRAQITYTLKHRHVKETRYSNYVANGGYVTVKRIICKTCGEWLSVSEKLI